VKKRRRRHWGYQLRKRTVLPDQAKITNFFSLSKDPK
jgi:hypothetical protein